MPLFGVEARIVDAEVRRRRRRGTTPRPASCRSRGPWCAKDYYNPDSGVQLSTDDGWMKTGDVAALDEYGSIRIADRTKDLIKSGGEWISSVDLKNVIMSHPKVKEAAVVGIPHPKWDERPLACVVLKEGEDATEEEILEFPQAEGGQVVAAGRRGVHRRGAQDQRRQVLEEGPARQVRRVRTPDQLGPPGHRGPQRTKGC